MKAIPSPNLALELDPNDNYFTEEPIGVLWIEFKLFISNWKRFDPYFPLLTKKNGLVFYFPSAKFESMKANLSQKAMKLAHWGTSYKLWSKKIGTAQKMMLDHVLIKLGVQKNYYGLFRSFIAGLLQKKMISCIISIFKASIIKTVLLHRCKKIGTVAIAVLCTSLLSTWAHNKNHKSKIMERASKLSVNISQKALKLGPNDNCFTEKLVGILWTEFKLFISNWSRFDCYLPLLKPKKRVSFFFFFFFFEWKQFPVQIWPWS